MSILIGRERVSGPGDVRGGWSNRQQQHPDAQNDAAKPILATFSLFSVAAIVGGILLTHWLMRARTLESVIARAPAAAVSMIWALMAFAIIIAQGAGSAFIYFQF